MAQSPRYKVYDARGSYQAAFKEIEAAAVVLAFYGDGSTIRLGHNWVLWQEGREAQPAAESYDFVAETCSNRADALRKQAR